MNLCINTCASLFAKKMKPMRLPEPPGSTQSIGGVPDIFEGGVYGVIRRAVVIGNGFPASENQSIGLVRALGLSERQTFYVKIQFCFRLICDA